MVVCPVSKVRKPAPQDTASKTSPIAAPVALLVFIGTRASVVANFLNIPNAFIFAVVYAPFCTDGIMLSMYPVHIVVSVGTVLAH
jgi:hypothetical protein